MKNLGQILAISIIAIGAAIGQPVITSDDGLKTGTSYINKNSSDPTIDPGTGGADQVWDFSNIVTDSDLDGSFEVLDVSQAPFADSFPDADVTIRNIDDKGEQYTFLKVTDQEIILLGVSDTSFGLRYADAETYITFPFTYESVFADTYKIVLEGDEDTIIKTGKVESVADGYGTLILPEGTYENVLRVKLTTQKKDTLTALGVFFTGNSKCIEYLWYSPEYHFILATHIVETDTSLGIPSMMVSFGYSIPNSTVSQREYLPPGWNMQVNNPVRGNLQITTQSEISFTGQISLIDLRGRIIWNKVVNIQSGNHVIRSQIPALTGHYIIQINTQGGLRDQKKIILLN